MLGVVLLLFLCVFVVVLIGSPGKCWIDRSSPLNYVIYKEPQRVYDAQIVNVWIPKPWRSDGTRIPCHLEKSPTASKRLIIYSHGNGEDIQDCIEFTRELSRALGADVLCYDYSGYGLNQSNTFERSEEGVNLTLRAVYEHLKPDYEGVFLWGYSLGSGPSVRLAAELAGDEDSRLLGAILFGAFSSISRVVRDKTHPKIANLFTDRWDNEKHIQTVACPILILHGQNDQVIPVTHARALKAANPAAALIVMPNTGHTAFSWPESIKEVKGWFEREFSK